jgi:hypothetical protein
LVTRLNALIIERCSRHSGSVLMFCKNVIQVLTYVEHHEDNAHDLFLVEVVEDLAYILHNHESEVSESLQGEWVVGENPQGAAHVVGDLAVLDAVVLKERLEKLEALAVNEVLGELVGLDHVHEAVGERSL